MKKMFLFYCSFAIAVALQARVIHVPADYPTIQQGIDHAATCDTVLVSPGNYVENIRFSSINITVASLYLTTQDTAYISQTIIDGNQNGSVVSFLYGNDSTCLLSGITIINGAYNFNTWTRGGGIYCNNHSSPTLKNLVITGNTNAEYGGGVTCLNQSNATLLDVTITGNTNMWTTGGLYTSDSDPSLLNVVISGNTAGGYDYSGGIYSLNSGLYMNNVEKTFEKSSLCRFWLTTHKRLIKYRLMRIYANRDCGLYKLA